MIDLIELEQTTTKVIKHLKELAPGDKIALAGGQCAFFEHNKDKGLSDEFLENLWNRIVKEHWE